MGDRLIALAAIRPGATIVTKDRTMHAIAADQMHLVAGADDASRDVVSVAEIGYYSFSACRGAADGQ